MNPEEKSKIDKLNKSLYSRNTPDIRSNRRIRLEEKDTTVSTDWQHETETTESLISQKYKEKTMSFFTKILITSIVFFCVALGIGTYLVLNGSNIVSANNVDVTVNGPLSVSGGEPVSFEVQISNQNNIKLQNVTFFVEYPTGTVDVQDGLKSLKNTREVIDDINPGGIGQRTLRAIFYGEENTKKSLNIVIEYNVQGSNATFKKIKTVDLLIASSPLNISIASFEEVNSGQEFELAVTLQSNSKEVIKNVLLKAVYPFGFNFISSDLKTTSSDNTSWRIGDIPPGSKKVVKIKGSLDAQNDESRNFRFIAGSPVSGSDKIATEYTSGTQEIAIKKPFMTVGVTMNSDSSNSQYITNFNTPVNVSVEYYNNLQTPITDAEIRVKIEGNALDNTAVSPQSGIYRAVDNEIIWNSLSMEKLRSIDAGGSGKVEFTVIPKDLSTRIKPITNPNIKFTVSIQGKRKSERNVPESITSTASREIRVSSIANIGGVILRNSGPFTNTGAIPPRVDQETTYTVMWMVDNTVNNLSNVQVQSSLPAYVKWLGKISPESEDLSYDSSTGQLTWNVGGVGTNTVSAVKKRQISFQISLNPTISQVDQAPIILNQSSLTAIDDFTGASLKSNLGSLNTRFATESGFKEGDEKVVK